MVNEHQIEEGARKLADFDFEDCTDRELRYSLLQSELKLATNELTNTPKDNRQQYKKWLRLVVFLVAYLDYFNNLLDNDFNSLEDNYDYTD